ncbi:class I SAM-dependent methyltransferase [Sorangium sp. So ce542]|uniref:class I SAM-dependent methyltransferase n=1 Tax=Sorangium sp. So ce542 TaxID=3133316 RepID=UPI003F5FBECC
MLERIWDRHRAAGLDEAAAAAAAPSPEELCYLAMLAFADERTADAAAFAARAAEASPGDPLFRAAAAHLARVAREGKRNVYVSAEGFAAFIRGGGNVPLYRETSAALAGQYPEAPFDLLDIGAGDGMALLPALTPAVRRVTVVEPAAPLLERCAAALSARGVGFEAFSGRFQDLAADPAMASRSWAVAQATFGLHAIAPAERPALLRWARARCDLLLSAEFDAPRMDEPSLTGLSRWTWIRSRCCAGSPPASRRRAFTPSSTRACSPRQVAHVGAQAHRTAPCEARRAYEGGRRRRFETQAWRLSGGRQTAPSSCAAHVRSTSSSAQLARGG